MGESVENLLRPSEEETGVGESVENLLRPPQRRRQVWVRVSRTYCVHQRRQVWVRVSRTYCVHHRGGDRCG